MCDGMERWKFGTVDGEDNVVRRVQCALAATIESSIVGLGRIYSEHVGGHLGREIIDRNSEFLRDRRAGELA